MSPKADFGSNLANTAILKREIRVIKIAENPVHFMPDNIFFRSLNVYVASILDSAKDHARLISCVI